MVTLSALRTSCTSVSSLPTSPCSSCVPCTNSIGRSQWRRYPKSYLLTGVPMRKIASTAGVSHATRRAKDDLVVQRPALGGERMTHDRDAGGILQLAIERLQPAGASIQIDMTKRLRIHDNLTSTESPSTRTACVVTAISGFPGHAPVTTSNPHKCQGQVISFPARSPSASGPPRCGQVLSVAKNPFAVW